MLYEVITKGRLVAVQVEEIKKQGDSAETQAQRGDQEEKELTGTDHGQPSDVCKWRMANLRECVPGAEKGSGQGSDSAGKAMKKVLP